MSCLCVYAPSQLVPFTAIGDYASEASVLLLANAGHWLPGLATADLIAVEYDGDPAGQPPGIGWVVTWVDVDPALRAGRTTGSTGQLRILRAAASLADGQPLDLGDVASGLDRRRLQLLLAAISHAGGSHEHRDVNAEGIAGDSLSPLVPWPARD